MLNKTRQMSMISFHNLSVKIQKIPPVFISGFVSTTKKAPSQEIDRFLSDVANI